MANWKIQDMIPGTMFADEHFLGHRIFLTKLPYKDEFGNALCVVYKTGEIMHYKQTEEYQPIIIKKVAKADEDPEG